MKVHPTNMSYCVDCTKVKTQADWNAYCAHRDVYETIDSAYGGTCSDAKPFGLGNRQSTTQHTVHTVHEGARGQPVSHFGLTNYNGAPVGAPPAPVQYQTMFHTYDAHAPLNTLL